MIGLGSNGPKLSRRVLIVPAVLLSRLFGEDNGV